MDRLQDKYEKLKELLSEMGSVLVAFSAGVDSTFLLYAAHEALQQKAAAVTAASPAVPGRETGEAEAFCIENGITLHRVDFDMLSVDGVRQNPANRCYLCKKALFSRFVRLAAEYGLACVAEGSNLDDEGDYRPGMRAISELGIRSPLREAGMTKEEIRLLSKKLGLPTWNKPSYACLATRLPYGEEITERKLSMIEQAEQELLDRGFGQMRVRMHGDLARIELSPEEMGKMLKGDAAAQISRRLHELGFSYVTLDLDGYRTGSMNPVTITA